MTHRSGAHISDLVKLLSDLDGDRLSAWGHHLAEALSGGGRLLVAGNGGSAAQAQHLSVELVGCFGTDRGQLSSLALHADTSALTAIGNDFGFEHVFSRQVEAHGRAGDILLVLTTSGRSINLLNAVTTARRLGLTAWALTGPVPNPLVDACDDQVGVDGCPANVQECHLVAAHLLCVAVDERSAAARLRPAATRTRDHTPPLPGHRWPSRARDLVVVGDVLVDETIDGQVRGISPDAPVPVVEQPSRDMRPGGAGLAALLAAGDEHQVTLITALAADDAAIGAEAALSAAGVTVINLGTTSATAIKTRIRAEGQMVLRLDHAEPAAEPGAMPEAGRAALERGRFWCPTTAAE